MVENRASEPGPQPPNMIDLQWSFLGPVVLDSVPGGAHPGYLAKPSMRCAILHQSTADACKPVRCTAMLCSRQNCVIAAQHAH